MDEKLLGLAMVLYEREQAAMNKRPPLPCDAKQDKRGDRGVDRTKQLMWLIEQNPEITTAELFEKVTYGHADFTASLRSLTEQGKILTGCKGRAKTYFARKKMKLV